MKKIIAVVLVIVSIFSLATSAMAACTCSTSKPGVNVRKKANKSSSAVGNVAKGTSVSVLCTTTGTDLNKDGNKIWYYVQVLSCASGSKNNINGKYGYIHSSLISGFNANQLDHPQNKDAAFSGKVLQNGSSGSEVRNVQFVLYAEGLLRDTDVDGLYGSGTKAAVEAYQERYFGHGAEGEPDPVDGLVGDKTKTHMWNKYQTSLMKYGYKY